MMTVMEDAAAGVGHCISMSSNKVQDNDFSRLIANQGWPVGLRGEVTFWY